MSNVLTAYFSASGVTAKVAHTLAQAAGADLFEIKPAVPYTAADLNYMDSKSRSSVEMKDLSFRPPMAEMLSNLQDYDTIFLGFPIWWYTAPTIIHTFLESGDFSGKTIIPFATSGGTGISKAEKALQAICPAANWKPGRLLNGASPDRLAQWVRELQL